MNGYKIRMVINQRINNQQANKQRRKWKITKKVPILPMTMNGSILLQAPWVINSHLTNRTQPHLTRWHKSAKIDFLAYQNMSIHSCDTGWYTSLRFLQKITPDLVSTKFIKLDAMVKSNMVTSGSVTILFIGSPTYLKIVILLFLFAPKIITVEHCFETLCL